MSIELTILDQGPRFSEFSPGLNLARHVFYQYL